MFKYKYTGRGIMTFEVEGKSYTVGKDDYRLKDVVELPKKVEIAGLEEVEEQKSRKREEKNKGE